MLKLRVLLIILFIFNLAACGFQLRGQVSELPFDKVFIMAPAGLTIGSDLERAISAHTQAQVVKEAAKSEVVIHIISAVNEKRILSLSGGGRVREFELGYRVAARVLDPNGTELMTLQEIRLVRILPFLDAQVLAKVAEEEMLYKDMQKDAVQHILRQITAVKPG
jgi:LPS-assembly lipoprotein